MLMIDVVFFEHVAKFSRGYGQVTSKLYLLGSDVYGQEPYLLTLENFVPVGK